MEYSHVLISRPGPETEQLAQIVEGLGLEPVCMPAFRFESGHAGMDFNSAWPPGKRRMAIFSSTRAVEFGLGQLPAGFLDGVEIVAIGPATGSALEAAGRSVSVVPRGEFTSEALLRYPALASQPGKALIFAAPGGRQKLYSGLQEAGWDVEFAHVYRAVPIEPEKKDVEAIMRSRKILSVWTSANALQQLSEKLDLRAWGRVCEGDFLVTSARLEKIAQDFSGGNIYMTDGPGNDAIRNRIVQLI